MNKITFSKNIAFIIAIAFVLTNILIICPQEKVSAGSYNGQDLALAILADPSTLVSSSYYDTDNQGHRQGIVLSSLGTMLPTNGSTFALLSTGIAGTPIVTTGATNPGWKRGTWFSGGQYGYPRDEAKLTMTLKVPLYMHYLAYDAQFFSAEYPIYVGSQYNDQFTATVNSPSKGTTTYIINVNSGDFVLNANDIPGTGFDIFAVNGKPQGVDWVDTTPRPGAADAGATALVTRQCPVSPNENVTVTFDIIDAGDNQFDSAAFIDNVRFSGYAATNITGKMTSENMNGGDLKCGDTIKYTITISNIGTANQSDNPGNEFEDPIPVNTTYVSGSATATSGTIAYTGGEITWNGGIPAESSVVLTFEVTVNQNLSSGIIYNQGTVYWDSNEDGINDANFTINNTMILTVFEPPSEVTEDFSNDTPGSNATQSYLGRQWFETSLGTPESTFEVVSGYHYSTPNSFKIKMRSTGSPQYWNYTLSQLESDMVWWEAYFACGNTSEAADLYMEFKNSAGNDIAEIKFDYAHEGSDPPNDWVLKLYYMDPTKGWTQLNSDFQNGSLYNDWYKLRIEKNGSSINYYLYRGEGLVDFKTSNQLSAPFSNFTRIEWSSTKNPVVCPMLFWDEHSVGLTH
jgi:uncharacterized repeat protein (TIGR01451 family)